ncbi:hypothetical protein MMC30_002946 [Trapelia coarctata]|nr:hypothetical protein [Trapelia coarctata]
MAPRNTLQSASGTSHPSKKLNKGFSVGPANLPDGTHRRKVQKIKKDLIHKAKLKRSYAKLKAREPLPTGKPPTYTRSSPSPSHKVEADPEPANLELHPARQAMLEAPEEANNIPISTTRGLHSASNPPPNSSASASTPPTRHSKKPKPIPFEKEAREAQRKKEVAEKRREEIEAARREREKKLEERERFRKAMAKARVGGKNGQRKLGRESQVLLERVRRVVGAG